MTTERIDAVVDAIKAIDSSLNVTVKEVTKTNDRVLTGLIVSEPEAEIAPTVYLENYDDMTAIEAAEHIIHEVRAAKDAIGFDSKAFLDWNKAKEHISFMLVNKKQNEKLLADLPYKTVAGDLAEIALYIVGTAAQGTGTIKIHKCHQNGWGVSTDELFAIAEENAPKITPANVNGMASVLDDLMGEGTSDEIIDPHMPEISVITNNDKTNGAGVMMYPGILKAVAKKYGADKLVILPSSIHEVLALPLETMDTLPAMSALVQEVNANEVPDGEILSDHAYVYDAKKDSIVTP